MRVAALIVLAACGGGSTPSPRTLVAELPATENRNLDLLLVVDDSQGLFEEQANLAAAFPSFFDRLAGALPEGRLPDLHLAVATSDLGTASSATPPAPPIGVVGQGGCADHGRGGAFTIGQATIPNRFVSDISLSDGSRQRNYEGDLAAVAGQLVAVGSNGCGFEQPLAAMHAALENNAANAGFRRPGAALGVMFLTDEDDCSVRDPALFGPETSANPLTSFRCTRFGVSCQVGGRTSDAMAEIGVKSDCDASRDPAALLDGVDGFHDFLLGLVDDPRQLLVGGVFGDPTPFEVVQTTASGQPTPSLAHSCRAAGPDGMLDTPDDQVADPAVRLNAFANLFPGRSVVGTVCNNDLTPPLVDFAQLLAFGIGTPCISAALVDVDATLDGLQPSCVVEDEIDGTTTPIVECDAADQSACWELIDDLTACRLGDHLRLSVRRSGPPDPRTVTTMHCDVQ